MGTKGTCEARMLAAARIQCGRAKERGMVDEMQAEGQLTDLIVQVNA